ncbi:MAG: sulfatase [Bryobacteraceae bacterium]|nr:sulfatase [Bryobacteraceae bacterium]
MVNRRQFLQASALSALCPVGAQTRRPNIVLILADDMGYNDTGFQGSADVATPRLDSLARGGVRFENGYVTHPFCSPSRAALLTGRYQQRFGHENNMVFDREDAVAGLPLSEATLPDLLGKAGYATGLVGKWHLGAHPRFHPMKRGFQEMYGFIGGGHDYFEAGSPGHKDQHFILLERDGKPVTKMGYLTTDLGREAAAFLKRHTADPFFLYLSYNAPHSPLQAPPSYLDKFAGIKDRNRRTYAAMVNAMDDSIGMVLDALRDAKLEDDTLVLFLNDNGGPQGNASSNRPLRGHKRTLYEGGVRVPFVMRWPGKLPKGATHRDPVSALDVLPTALAAAGLPVPKGLDGRNLLPYLQTPVKPQPPRQLFWRIFGGHQHAVRDGRWKLIRNPDKTSELYDLQTDGGETRNLAAKETATARRLEAAIDDWNRGLVAPLWKDHIFHKAELSAPR